MANGAVLHRQAKGPREIIRGKLAVMGMEEIEVLGDGNCQYRALSHQLYGTENLYPYIRRQIVCELRAHPWLYRAEVLRTRAASSYRRFIKDTTRDKSWGCFITLRAAAEKFGVQIDVITDWAHSYDQSFSPSGAITPLPRFTVTFAERHYNSTIRLGVNSNSGKASLRLPSKEPSEPHPPPLPDPPKPAASAADPVDKTAFSGGSGVGADSQKPASSSLLADWNSYAASQTADDSSGLGFDLESAVRSANDTVSGTFSVVSKGVRDLPGSLQSATSSVPSGKALMYFGLFLATGVFFVFIAFTMFLPVMVLMPQKFAICFTLGCAFIIGSFFALRGPQNQLAHMSSKERLPFTLGFLGSMVGTIYVSMVLHSYVLSVFFSVLQVLSLAYYAVSYFPGGSAGLKFLSSALTSSVMRCFGR